jgi:nitrous oxide reductase accessory protein NosL
MCVQQGRPIAHKFESGWELFGVIRVFDKTGPDASKFSMKYTDDPNWWTHSLLGSYFLFLQEQIKDIIIIYVRVMKKTSTGFCFGS